MLLAPAVKAISVAGMLTRNFHASFSIIYSPNIHYNDKRSCFALLEPRPCLIPSVTRESTAQSPYWYFQLSLTQHHLVVSVLDSSPLGRLLRRRQFTSTFSEQIDLAHSSFCW